MTAKIVVRYQPMILFIPDNKSQSSCGREQLCSQQKKNNVSACLRVLFSVYYAFMPFFTRNILFREIFVLLAKCSAVYRTLPTVFKGQQTWGTKCVCEFHYQDELNFYRKQLFSAVCLLPQPNSL